MRKNITLGEARLIALRIGKQAEVALRRDRAKEAAIVDACDCSEVIDRLKAENKMLRERIYEIRACAKCGGSGSYRYSTGDYGDCPSCDGKGH